MERFTGEWNQNELDVLWAAIKFMHFKSSMKIYWQMLLHCYALLMNSFLSAFI